MKKVLKYSLVSLAAVVAAALSAAYYLFDPMQSTLAPKCLFKMATGWDCPGCGSQRMLHALLHGDIAAAWEANPMPIIVFPALAILAFSSAFRSRWPRFYALVNSAPVVIALAAAIIIWWVVRNLSL